MKIWQIRVMASCVGLILSTPTLAAKIQCQTPSAGQIFTLEVDKVSASSEAKADLVSFNSAIVNHTVANYETTGFNSHRGLSSITPISTHLSQDGLVKVIRQGSLEYKIEIKSLQKYSELDDNIVITDGQGHEVTYPLQCENT